MAERRARAERGFTLIEMIVTMIIIAILISVTVMLFSGSRTTARNKALQGHGQTMFEALVHFNRDWPVLPGSTYGDPLVAGGMWDDTNFATPVTDAAVSPTGLAGPSGTIYVKAWPENPWQGRNGGQRVVQVLRGGAPASPGQMGVVRVAGPAGSFQLTVMGMDRAGKAPAVIMRRTFLASTANDCGYHTAPADTC